MLEDIVEKLFGYILDLAPAARRDKRRIRLGDAVLEVQGVWDEAILLGTFSQSAWDVISGARIQVIQGAGRDPHDSKHYEWSASLWYARLKGMQNYRWYEVSYFSAFKASEYAPFALDFPEADRAAGPGMDVYQIAFGPDPIDDEVAERFCDRWANLLAQASQGQLCHPRYLPLQ